MSAEMIHYCNCVKIGICFKDRGEGSGGGDGGKEGRERAD